MITFAIGQGGSRRNRYPRARTVTFAEGTVAGVREQVTGVIGKVQQKAAANLSQVEGVVGGQVTRVLVAPGDAVEGGQPLLTIA